MRNKIAANISGDGEADISDVITERGNYFIKKFTTEEVSFITNSKISEVFAKFDI